MAEEFLSNFNFANVLGGVSLMVCVLVIKRKYFSRSFVSGKDYPKDTVILHHAGKGPYAPSLSPFIVKLETFLKLANIPYQIVRDYRYGPKGKVPWMEYNGEVIADSQLCIEYLTKTLKLTLSEDLSPSQKAVMTAFQRMVDEHTYWLMLVWRWRLDEDKTCLKIAKWSRIKIFLATQIMRRNAYVQGVGRHTKQEVIGILRRDFEALSTYLGEKNFFFGDKATEIDCSIFGQLSQFLWHLPKTEVATILKDDYKNLYDYCFRIKSELWKDWNVCVMYPEVEF